MSNWDERYASEEYVYGTEPNDFLASVYSRIPPGRVLCLAEGEGRNAVFLAGKGYSVTAVDLSTVGLEKTRRLADEQGVRVETIHSDLANLEFENGTFSGIVSIWAHVPPPTRIPLHWKVADWLVPGGVFILEAYTPDQLKYRTGGPNDPVLLVNAAMLRRELSDLDLEIVQEVERDIHEGRLHDGHSAVVQVLGIKPTAETRS